MSLLAKTFQVGSPALSGVNRLDHSWEGCRSLLI